MALADDWNALVEEMEAAAAEKKAIFRIVFDKMNAIAERRSNENPTEDELERYNTAIDRVHEIDLRMRAFCKANA